MLSHRKKKRLPFGHVDYQNSTRKDLVLVGLNWAVKCKIFARKNVGHVPNYMSD